MTAAYQELQKAFSDMEDRFDDFRVEFGGLVQDVREDLAGYLGISPNQITFFKTEDLYQLRQNQQDGIPTQYNDSDDCGELLKGSSYQIGLCLAVCYKGENLPAWYLMTLLELEKNGDEFTLNVEKNVHSFELGQYAKERLRTVSEWLVPFWKQIANQRYENFVSGKAEKQIGFCVRLNNSKKKTSTACAVETK